LSTPGITAKIVRQIRDFSCAKAENNLIGFSLHLLGYARQTPSPRQIPPNPAKSRHFAGLPNSFLLVWATIDKHQHHTTHRVAHKVTKLFISLAKPF
jgi:hypothetical protein